MWLKKEPPFAMTLHVYGARTYHCCTAWGTPERHSKGRLACNRLLDPFTYSQSEPSPTLGRKTRAWVQGCPPASALKLTPYPEVGGEVPLQAPLPGWGWKDLSRGWVGRADGMSGGTVDCWAGNRQLWAGNTLPSPPLPYRVLSGWGHAPGACSP